MALQGTFRGERRWLLDKALRQVEWLEAQTGAEEEEIERRVGSAPSALEWSHLRRWRGAPLGGTGLQISRDDLGTGHHTKV